MDADRHVHPRPAARSTTQRLKIESTGDTLLAAWRHHTPDRPPPCRRCRHRGGDPVKVATNATIFVFIESGGVIVIFSAGQHSSSDAQARCKLPVASTAITGSPRPRPSSASTNPEMPSRDTGNDIGSASNPVPSLIHTRLNALPGSTATITVDGSSATSNTDMSEVVPGLVEVEVAVPRSRPAVW